MSARPTTARNRLGWRFGLPETIRGQLAFLVAVVATPLVVLEILFATWAANSALEEATARSLRIARSIAGRLDDHVQNVESVLAVISATVPPSPEAVEVSNAALRGIRARLPSHFGSISILRPDGTMLHSAESPPPPPGSVNVADRRYFRDAVATGALAVGDPVVSRTSGKWIVVFARPLREGTDGPLLGVVSASTLLERIQDLFATVQLPEGSAITVLDREGVVLASSREPSRMIGTKPFSVAAVQESLREAEGPGFRVEADGVERVAGFARVTRAPWLVNVGIPTQAALAGERDRMRWRLLAAVFVTALAAGAAAMIGRRIAGPLRELMRDAVEIASGNLVHRSTVAGTGEVGNLAASLNEMTSALESERSRVRKSEARLRNLFEQAADGILLVSADNRIVDANREALRMLGYEREELLKLGVADLLAERELARLQPEVADMLAGRPHLAEWTHRRRDGSTFDAEVSARPISKGEYLAILRDLTDRRQTEREMRVAALRLQAAVRAGNVGLWDWDLRTDRVFYSPEWKRQLGYEPLEVGNEFSEWESRVHPEDIDAALHAVRAFLDSGKTSFEQEFRMRHRDGSYRWILSQGSRLRDPVSGEDRFLGSHIDITGRRQLELEASAALDRFEKIFLGAPEAMIISDIGSGRLELVNNAFCELFGGLREQLVGRTLRDLGFWADSAKQGEVVASLRENHAVHGFEAQVRRKSGEPRDVNISGEILQSDTNERLLLMFTDVTERTRAEREIRNLNAMLERRVAERTAELEAAKQRAETADRVKSVFLSTMSHELRTPLNSIIGFTGLLLQRLPGPLNAEQEKQLGIVRSASRHLLALVSDVLDISKVEAGELRLERARFELRPLLERLGSTFAQEAARRGLSFAFDPGPKECVVINDARRVEQVLNNLLSNAMKFTIRGEVSLACGRKGDCLEIVVADTGVGIRAEDMPRLFQPFVQVDAGSVSPREGTGLGLAISAQLARAMGGALTVQSEWGKGTRFRFALPAGEA